MNISWTQTQKRTSPCLLGPQVQEPQTMTVARAARGAVWALADDPLAPLECTAQGRRTLEVAVRGLREGSQASFLER